MWQMMWQIGINLKMPFGGLLKRYAKNNKKREKWDHMRFQHVAC